MIHLTMSITDSYGTYAKFAGTCLESVFANTHQLVMVHLLHDDTLSDKNRKRFLELARRHGQTILFYNMSQLVGRRLAASGAKITSRFSPASLYRLLLADVLPEDIEQVVYLDADIICHLDIARLVEACQGMTEALAAVTEESNDMRTGALADNGLVASEDYFNSGVLVINMPLFRSVPRLLEDGMAMLARYDNYRLPDQDILNYFFARDCRHLPRIFNNSVKFAYINAEPVRPAVYHYAGNQWTLDTANDPYSALFVHYFAATPWSDAEFWRRLLAGLAEMSRTEQQEYLQQVAVIAGRRRVFLVHPADVEHVRDEVALRQDDVVLTVQGGNIELSSELCRNSVLIVCLAWYRDLVRLLTGAGLVEGRDFVDGRGLVFSNMSRVHDMWERAACVEYLSERESPLLIKS